MPFIEYPAIGGVKPQELFIFSYVHTMQDETDDTFNVCVKNYLTVESDVLNVLFIIASNLPYVELVDLPAYDAFWLPGFHLPKFSRKLIFNYLQEKCKVLKTHAFNDGEYKRKYCLLIENPKSGIFELGRSAGASRKHIPNHDDLVNSLSRRTDWSIMAVYFEDSNSRKVFMMQNSDLFIYQSGAAMTAIYFLRKGSSVIEIVPRNYHSKDSPWSNGYGACSILCDQLGLKHMRFFQDGNHAPVNVEAIYRMACV